MFMDFTVPVPVLKGRVFIKKVRGFRYVHYQYDSVYMAIRMVAYSDERAFRQLTQAAGVPNAVVYTDVLQNSVGKANPFPVAVTVIEVIDPVDGGKVHHSFDDDLSGTVIQLRDQLLEFLNRNDRHLFSFFGFGKLLDRSSGC